MTIDLLAIDRIGYLQARFTYGGILLRIIISAITAAPSTLSLQPVSMVSHGEDHHSTLATS